MAKFSETPVLAICAAAGAILGVVSSGIGIWAAIGNQQLKLTSDAQQVSIAEQKERIDLNDAALRQDAESRANVTASREYLIKVYEQTMKLLEAPDPRKAQVALALIKTVPDPNFQLALSGVVADLATDDSTKEQAKKLAQTATADIAQGWSYGIWSYGVYWCEANPLNADLAAQISRDMGRTNPKVVTVQPWSQQQNNEPAYGVRGIEVRYVAIHADQANQVKTYLTMALRKEVALKLVAPSRVIPNFVGIFVCT